MDADAVPMFVAVTRTCVAVLGTMPPTKPVCPLVSCTVTVSETALLLPMDSISSQFVPPSTEYCASIVELEVPASSGLVTEHVTE